MTGPNSPTPALSSSRRFSISQSLDVIGPAIALVVIFFQWQALFAPPQLGYDTSQSYPLLVLMAVGLLASAGACMGVRSARNILLLALGVLTAWVVVGNIRVVLYFLSEEAAIDARTSGVWFETAGWIAAFVLHCWYFLGLRTREFYAGPTRTV